MFIHLSVLNLAENYVKTEENVIGHSGMIKSKRILS